MKDLTWNVFTMTGNIDTYLLYKEIEGELETPSEGSEVDGNPNPLHN